MASLLGSGTDQVPTNGLLGSMAFVDKEGLGDLIYQDKSNVSITGGAISGVTAAVTGNASTALQVVPKQQLDSVVTAEKFGRLINVKTITTVGAGSYTPTTGTKSIVVEMVGPGGPASAYASTNLGVISGGGAGGYYKFHYDGSLTGITYLVGESASLTNTEFYIGAFTVLAGRGFAGSLKLTTDADGYTLGGSGGSATTGGTVPAEFTEVIRMQGQVGGNAFKIGTTLRAGDGGSSVMGFGTQGMQYFSGSTYNSSAPVFGHYGAGRGGYAKGNSANAAAIYGSDGCIIIWEYA